MTRRRVITSGRMAPKYPDSMIGDPGPGQKHWWQYPALPAPGTEPDAAERAMRSIRGTEIGSRAAGAEFMESSLGVTRAARVVRARARQAQDRAQRSPR